MISSIMVLAIQAAALQTKEEVSQSAKTFVSRLLCVFLAVAPFFMLLLLVYGGIKYVGGADNPQERQMARNLVINAVIGGVLVTALVVFAERYGVSRSLC